MAAVVGRGGATCRRLGVFSPVAAGSVGVGLQVLTHHLQVALTHKLGEALQWWPCDIVIRRSLHNKML